MTRTLTRDLPVLSLVDDVRVYRCVVSVEGEGGEVSRTWWSRHGRPMSRVASKSGWSLKWILPRQTWFICDRAVSSSAILALRLLTSVCVCVCVVSGRWWGMKVQCYIRLQTNKDSSRLTFRQTWLICDRAASSSAIFVLRLLTVCTSEECSWLLLLWWGGAELAGSETGKMALPSGSL